MKKFNILIVISLILVFIFCFISEAPQPETTLERTPEIIGYEIVTEEVRVLDHYEVCVEGYATIYDGSKQQITSKKPVYKTEIITREIPIYE